MPFTVNAFHHKEWEQHGLKDYGDFAEQTSECNVQTWGDDTTSGEWFFIDDDVLPPMQGVDYGSQKPNEKAIYFGTWGNDHSPGASTYTNAEIFDMDDPEEVAEYEKRKAEWEAAPETIDDEDEEVDEDDYDDEDDDDDEDEDDDDDDEDDDD
jgi:hypothetical protein